MPFPDDLTPAQQIGFVLRLISDVLDRIDYSAEQEASLMQVTDDPAFQMPSVFADLSQHGQPITALAWVLFYAWLLRFWDEGARVYADQLVDARAVYRGDMPAETHELFDAMADVLAGLGRISNGHDSGTSADVEIIPAMVRLARAAENHGFLDRAYDFAAAALIVDADDRAGRAAAARYGLALAMAANKPHQVTVCGIELASLAIKAAADNPDVRIEAFHRCEVAMEWLAVTPEPFRPMLAMEFVRMVKGVPYLAPLLMPMGSFLPEAEKPPGFSDLVGAQPWPTRVSSRPVSDWLGDVVVRRVVQQWESEIDNARFALEPVGVTEKTAQADWIDWTIKHPAYRRAVPQNRSFLRESEFDSLLLVLTHELTHIFSLIGGIGAALTAFRFAALANELRIWMHQRSRELSSEAEQTADEQLLEEIARMGISPLIPGDAAMLYRAELGLELTKKAQILQDVWSPWFEGVAVFGEVGADPALDPAGITPVTLCLRNLIDLYPSGQATTLEELQAELEQEITLFEERCSKAIAVRGPSRLAAYLRERRVPYLSGYLVVRSIVAGWRKTAGRPVTATDAYQLLLHALQFGTHDAVPDLSLRSDAFRDAATKRMAEWVRSLSFLTRDELEDFWTPPERNGPGRPYLWANGHIARPTPTDLAEQESFEDRVFNRRLGQAFRSLTDDEERQSPEESLRALALRLAKENDIADEETARYIDGATRTSAMGTILPIGRCSARFFLNTDPATSQSNLLVYIRTTESHERDRQPSVNGLTVPVSPEAANAITAAFRATGDPRLEVTRVIDILGFGTKSKLTGVHYLALKYGDWFHLQASTPALEKIMAEDEERRAFVVELVKDRLYPSPVRQAEAGIIARGVEGARRTASWIEGSTDWKVDTTVVDADAWSSEINQLAASLLDPKSRQVRQRAAARALAHAVFGDEEFSRCVVDDGFEAMTDAASSMREAVVKALFTSAQSPSIEAEFETIETVFRAAGEPVFRRSSLGWDVRPPEESSTVSAP